MPDLDYRSVLSDSSRALMDYTAASVGNDPHIFEGFLGLAYEQKPPLCGRAARVVDLSCERNPALIRPHLVEMVRRMPELRDMSVKRVFLHILVRHSWVEDEEVMGKFIDTLFRWVLDSNQSIAVIAYSIVILENIVKIEPGLVPELTAVLDAAIPLWESAALRHAGKKVLKSVRSLKTQY